MQPSPYHRGYAQPVPQGRRGPMGPTPHPNRRADAHQGNMMPPGAPTNAHQMEQDRKQEEAAKRRANKPTDKTMPDGVEDIVIGDGVQRYKDLRDFERRLDATMTRKRLDITDSVERFPKRYKTMRVWITNTVEDQPWQASALTSDAFDFSSGAESTWRVKVEGRLLDDEDDNTDDEDDEIEEKVAQDPDRMDTDNIAPAKKALKPAAKPSRFSHFFKSITVDFDRRPDLTAEWTKTIRSDNGRVANTLSPRDDFDEFVFKRNGDDNVNITVNLHRQEEPQCFQLSPALADVVDMNEGSNSEVIMALWDYIKLMGLQEDEDKRNFRCDEPLRKLIGADAGRIPDLENYLTNGKHLLPLAPHKLEYTIRTDEAFHKDPQPTIYDVRVAVPSPLKARLGALSSSQQYTDMLKEVAALDDGLAVLVQAIGQSKAKHAFLTSLSRDPTNFVKAWLSSQKRDLEVIMGESTRNGGGDHITGDEWRMGGSGSVWGTQNARESVNVLLAKQPGR